MSNARILTCAPPHAIRRANLAAAPSRLHGVVATWLWRRRFRRELEEMALTNPHMIEDIGLKRWQVEAELAKPFWRR